MWEARRDKPGSWECVIGVASPRRRGWATELEFLRDNAHLAVTANVQGPQIEKVDK